MVGIRKEEDQRSTVSNSGEAAARLFRPGETDLLGRRRKAASTGKRDSAESEIRGTQLPQSMRLCTHHDDQGPTVPLGLQIQTVP